MGMPQYLGHITEPVRAFYTGTDTLKEGYALCFDHDAAAFTLPDGSSSNYPRSYNVEKPSFNNISHFAGVVHPTHAGKVGPCEVELYHPSSLHSGIKLWCDESVTAGDLLGIQPNSYAFVKGAIFDGAFRGRALETVDRSGTAGTVLSEYGLIIPTPYEKQAQVLEINGLLDVGGMNGATTSGVWIGTVVTAGSAQMTAGGAVIITGGSAADADGYQIQRGGIPIIISANKKLYMEMLITVANVANSDLYFGLAALDTTIFAAGALNMTNYVGWVKSTGNGVMLHGGDKAGAATTVASTTLVDGTPCKFAMLVNGIVSTTQYINDAAVTGLVTANIPIVGVTPSFSCKVNAAATAPTLTIARYLVRQQL